MTEATVSILIIDDEPDNLEALVQAFREWDSPFRILKAPGGTIGLDLAQQKLPDLVIVDWHMPEMSGVEFIRKLRASATCADIPVIMCTGVMTTSENLRTALEAGASDYIRKPVDSVELMARTNAMLQLAGSIKKIKQQNQELKESYLKMEQMARKDPLTGLSNRRDFIEKLRHVMAEADRYERTFVVGIGDIDEFKAFNDTYGHDLGDEVLIHVADYLQNQIRRQDFVGRWGGEEFIFLFPETDEKGGQIIAEKIRQYLAQNPVVLNRVPHHVTMTIGLVECHSGDSLEQCIAQADRALYFGKENGRNQVCVFSQLE